MASSTPEQPPDPRRNALLRALPPEELDRLEPLLDPVALAYRDQLFEADAPVEHVYFPTAGVLSQVIPLPEGTVIEVNTIGREGMAGLAAFLGATSSSQDVFCQIPGQALRLSAAGLHRHLGTNGADLHQVLNRYTQATLVQLARGVACNRAHSVEERMSRWLLLTRDRVDGDTFPLTQQFLAQMLGVRRATVSLTASALQQAGLISYRRGQLTVRDRSALEETSCECYRVVRDEFDELLPQSTSPN